MIKWRSDQIKRVVSDGERYVVLVHKVASSTLSTVLEHEQGWREVIEYDPSKPIYGLVRHPVFRWVSGICQDICPWFDAETMWRDGSPEKVGKYLYLKSASPDHVITAIDKFGYTPHTQPQTKYYEPFIKQIQLFRFAPSGIDLFWNELGIERPRYRIRDHNDLGLQGKLYEHIQGAAYANEKHISERYKGDMDLFERAMA
jgi:hypothetical protein